MEFLKYAAFLQIKSGASRLLSTSWIRCRFLVSGTWDCTDTKQLPWAEVRKEMTQEKGLDPTVADKIGQYVKQKGAGQEGKHDPSSPHSALISSAIRGTEATAITPGRFCSRVEQERESRIIGDDHPLHPPAIVRRPRQGMLKSLTSTLADRTRRRSHSICLLPVVSTTTLASSMKQSSKPLLLLVSNKRTP